MEDISYTVDIVSGTLKVIKPLFEKQVRHLKYLKRIIHLTADLFSSFSLR